MPGPFLFLLKKSRFPQKTDDLLRGFFIFHFHKKHVPAACQQRERPGLRGAEIFFPPADIPARADIAFRGDLPVRAVVHRGAPHGSAVIYDDFQLLSELIL